MTRAIHQLVPVLSSGDAIGAAVVKLRDILRSLGHASTIFAGLADRHAGVRTERPEQLLEALAPGDAVLYHLSTGSPLAALFEAVPATRILYYHNITPAEHFHAFSASQEFTQRWGRADLAALAPLSDLALTPSRYNSAELSAARRIAVVPLPLNLERLRPRRSQPPSDPVLLFVGKFSPHKRHDTLIRLLTALRATRSPRARLVFAGTATTPGYIDALIAFADALGVRAAIDFHVDVPDRMLGDLYAHASVFVCASEHEGYCVPLAEAMAFSVPVLARAAGAVPETVGDAGIVVADDDPFVWAELAWRLATDTTLRQALAASAVRRLEALSGESVVEALRRAISSLN